MNPLISALSTSAQGNCLPALYEKVSVTREQLLTMREVCCDFDKVTMVVVCTFTYHNSPKYWDILYFLLCFSMNYRDFLVKLKPIISLFQTMKLLLLDLHCLGLLSSPLFHEFSAKSCPKDLNTVYWSEITAMTLTFYDRTFDSTCAGVMLFLHVISDRLSLTAALFLRRFLVFYCFKCYFGSFSRCKLVFSPNIIPP